MLHEELMKLLMMLRKMQQKRKKNGIKMYALKTAKSQKGMRDKELLEMNVQTIAWKNTQNGRDKKVLTTMFKKQLMKQRNNFV